MKRILLICLATMAFVNVNVKAQEEENKFKSDVSGIVWYQYFYDTYQNVETRDGALLLYPKPKDAVGINETGKMGSSAFFSRLRVKFSGAEAFGAKASGMLEGDFFATSQTMVGHFRLRHAFVKLDWDRSSVLFGQYWHTMVDTDVIPAADLIANVPYFPLHRSPQINFKYKFTNELSFDVAALVHSYHRSTGPELMQRNSGLPEFAGKLKYKKDNIVFGVNGGVKTVKPRIATERGQKAEETISTPYFGAFTSVNTDPVTFKAQIIYGQDLTHFVMIGGIGAKGDTTGVDDFEYSALKTLSTWADLHTNGEKVQVGLFFGYSRMMGATGEYMSLEINGAALNRSDNLSSTMRIAPRIDFFSTRMKIGIEYSYTNAIYGSAFDNEQNVTTKLDAVANSRFLLNVMYKF